MISLVLDAGETVLVKGLTGSAGLPALGFARRARAIAAAAGVESSERLAELDPATGRLVYTDSSSQNPPDEGRAAQDFQTFGKQRARPPHRAMLAVSLGIWASSSPERSPAQCHRPSRESQWAWRPRGTSVGDDRLRRMSDAGGRGHVPADGGDRAQPYRSRSVANEVVWRGPGPRGDRPRVVPAPRALSGRDEGWPWIAIFLIIVVVLRSHRVAMVLVTSAAVRSGGSDGFGARCRSTRSTRSSGPSGRPSRGPGQVWRCGCTTVRW